MLCMPKYDQVLMRDEEAEPAKNTERLSHIPVFMETKNKSELFALLLNLVQGMDEPDRQLFWERLAPPGVATADFRYPSPEVFLAELEVFAEKVSDGKDYDEERLILATGRYLGEGFDDARLDTLILALPISWRGTLAQYAGRLHRLYELKTDVLIYDYVDGQVPALTGMFEKRRKGYKVLGYEIVGVG
jgi:hypothetical protein